MEHWMDSYLSCLPLAAVVPWLSRNKSVFEGQEMHLIQLINKISHLTSDLHVAFPPTSSIIHREMHWVSWGPPLQGWIKLNSDGCGKGNPGLAAISGVFRNVYGTWICGFAARIVAASSFTAELWAVRTGFQIALAQGYMNLWMESDLQILVDALMYPSTDRHPHKALIDNCKALLADLSHCKLTHVLQEGNCCADFKANLGVSLDLNVQEFVTAPARIANSLRADAMGILFPRS